MSRIPLIWITFFSRNNKNRSALRNSTIESVFTEEQSPASPVQRRTSQRLAKQPSVEEITQSSVLNSTVEGFPGDTKVLRSCTTRSNTINNNTIEKNVLDEQQSKSEGGGSITRHRFNSSKTRSSQRTKTLSNHVSKNNNNHLKDHVEEFANKRFEDKKFEDLQRKLTDSIRIRDEAAAALTALPADLRPPTTIDSSSSMEVVDSQPQRLHTTAPTTIDYRISDPQCLNNCTVIAQSDNIPCEFTTDSTDSKGRVKLKIDSDEMVLSSSLMEPMDTFIPIDISQPILDDNATKKIFLTDSGDSMDDSVLCNGQEPEDKRRKRDDRKDDKNKKKKLKPLEEENLSK